MAFPDGFWWGTGASSTQCEGVAPAADFAPWVAAGHMPDTRDGNGFAANFRDDFRLYAALGLTHHRLSIEWARCEPEPGRHDAGAVEHYREILSAGRDAGLQMWVCLHHFTLPGWFADDEGSLADDRARSRYWQRHVDWVGETFGDLVFGWKPVNEPIAYAAGGFLVGTMPPGRSDLLAFAKALRGAHLAAHEAWRLLRNNGQPVATIHNLAPLYPGVRGDDPAERDRARATTDVVDQGMWRSWIRALRDGVLEVPFLPPEEIPEMAGSFDLVGFSYYAAQTVYEDAVMGPYPLGARVGPMGYAPWSEGLRLVLDRLATELPGRALLVAEHGVGTTEDDWRCEILRASIDHVADAIADGIDVRGFFHWTGVDNYEWGHGFDVSFGCIDRDRNPKPSAELLAGYARPR